VDEIYVFMGPMLIGGDSAPTLLDGQGYRKDFPALRLASVEQLDKGVLLKWTLPGESR
jgi:2,5-diamino-6-(ribosylamino)-4(3H)-pyrimidinone 5'-phosphate reductase